MNEAATERLHAWGRRSLIAAAASSAGAVWLLISAHDRALQGYWVAWLFWTGLALGAAAVLMLANLTGGQWTHAIRFPSEAAAMTLPMMALLVIPVLADQRAVFPWAAGDLFAEGRSPHKAAYLQPSWFALRSCVYLGLMTVVAWPLSSSRWRGFDRMQALSAAGLVAYFAVMLFAASDWLLSLEPRFYSSMAVVELATSQFLPALAWVTFVALTFNLCEGVWDRGKQQRDLGNLLLAFVIFWAYISFSQFLIIWSGNLPREIGWYLRRSHGWWPTVAVVLATTQLGVPFIMLLSRAAKSRTSVLAAVALLVFCANLLHVWWLTAPGFDERGQSSLIPTAVMMAAVGGLWLGLFCRNLRRRMEAAASRFHRGVES